MKKLKICLGFIFWILLLRNMALTSSKNSRRRERRESNFPKNSNSNKPPVQKSPYKKDNKSSFKWKRQDFEAPNPARTQSNPSIYSEPSDQLLLTYITISYSFCLGLPLIALLIPLPVNRKVVKPSQPDEVLNLPVGLGVAHPDVLLHEPWDHAHILHPLPSLVQGRLVQTDYFIDVEQCECSVLAGGSGNPRSSEDGTECEGGVVVLLAAFSDFSVELRVVFLEILLGVNLGLLRLQRETHYRLTNNRKYTILLCLLPSLL